MVVFPLLIILTTDCESVEESSEESPPVTSPSPPPSDMVEELIAEIGEKELLRQLFDIEY